MAYCIAKSIEIQRSKALKEIFLEGRSIAQVARRFGRNRSTFLLLLVRRVNTYLFPLKFYHHIYQLFDYL